MPASDISGLTQAIKARIIQKHDTEENWQKATNFVPKKGEIIVYDIDSNHTYERLKIGDGVTVVSSLPFLDPMLLNLENGTGVNALQQKKDAGYTGVAIKTKNPNAYALDNTLTDNEPIGATGDYASSFGGTSSAQGKRSHAEGTSTIAKGKYSHAEGDNSVALGHDSHAEGYTTVAKGQGSHAEGIVTQANGYASHAEGAATISSHECSHSEGCHTITSSDFQHVEGKYNADNSKAIHIVGNGNSDTDRKNAFEVLLDGRAKVQSAPIEDNDAVRKIELDKKITGTFVNEQMADMLF